MSTLIALTISIGVLALVATYVFLGPLAAMNAQIWQAFIAWGCFYHSAVIGALSVLLIAQLGALGALAAPVAVGIGVAVLVLGAHLPALSTIPASVYGFASIAGLILLKGMAPLDALAPTGVSIILGAALGWLSEFIAGKLAKK